ncbi:MAG: ATP-binding protein [Verrucomicrobia bacterium]|nr:ATP-binding protein [Verrucomicrobiota bacterium]
MDPQPAPTLQAPLPEEKRGVRKIVATMAVSLGMVLVVAVVDYLTGLEISVSLLYLVPVCWSAWFGGRSAGLFVAAVSAAAWLGHEMLLNSLFDHPWVLAWNTLTLGVSFALVAVLMATLELTQKNLEATVAKRSAKLREEVMERRQAEEQLRHVNAELQQTQMQLIEAAKMEMVGRMAAGVAHEVKNPLMILGMGADYFLQRQATSNAEASLLQDMKDAVRRATHIINLMLDFSKPRPLHLVPEDLNTLVINSLDLVRHLLLKHSIEVVRELQANLPVLPLDRTRLEHVFVNLFTNAAQAMPIGGTLTVRSSLQEVSGVSSDPGPRVMLEIEDTGPGIRPEHLPKIFEAFYTTKPPGQGTGLGLAIVRRILHIHGANIVLGNHSEGGARATLTFNLTPKSLS